MRFVRLSKAASGTLGLVATLLTMAGAETARAECLPQRSVELRGFAADGRSALIIEHITQLEPKVVEHCGDGRTFVYDILSVVRPAGATERFFLSGEFLDTRSYLAMAAEESEEDPSRHIRELEKKWNLTPLHATSARGSLSGPCGESGPQPTARCADIWGPVEAMPRPAPPLPSKVEPSERGKLRGRCTAELHFHEPSEAEIAKWMNTEGASYDDAPRWKLSVSLWSPATGKRREVLRRDGPVAYARAPRVGEPQLYVEAHGRWALVILEYHDFMPGGVSSRDDIVLPVQIGEMRCR